MTRVRPDPHGSNGVPAFFLGAHVLLLAEQGPQRCVEGNAKYTLNGTLLTTPLSELRTIGMATAENVLAALRHIILLINQDIRD